MALIAPDIAPKPAPNCRGRRDRRSAVGAAGPVLALVLVLAVSLWVRLDGLERYSTTDEAYWIQRTIRFGAALARGDLASTFRAGHPGVTVMWTGLLGIGPGRLAPFLPERFTRYTVLERHPDYPAAFTAARKAVAVVAALLVTATVGLSWRLVGAGPALTGAVVLALDPYVVGVTRLLHVDALLAPLVAVSLLAGLIFWIGGGGWAFLALSAVAGGLALLTKAPAGVLTVYFALVTLAQLLRGGRSRHVRLVSLVAWGVGAALTFLALFPALWVDPIRRIHELILFVAAVGLQPHNGNFFLGRPILDDPGPFYYPIALALRLGPLAVLGLAGLALPSPADGVPARAGLAAPRWLLLFVVLFVGLLTLGAKKHDRYLLPALVVLNLLAGVGLWRLAQLAAHQAGRRGAAAMLLAVCLVVQASLLASAQPYPIAFYSPLAGGAEGARQTVMVGWGEGLEQAAAYLSQLPDAERLSVATSYHHVVRPRFPGTVIPLTAYLRESAGPLPRPDFVLLYVNAVQRRQVPAVAARAMAAGPPVFVARVNGQEYAWVYRVPASEPHADGPMPTDIEDNGDEE